MATTTKADPRKKTNETDTHRCDHRKVEIGSVFSRHSHGVVVAINRQKGFATLRNSTGREWDIGLNILEWECSFADQFDREETVSTTKAIEILEDHPMTAMTITFHKKVKEADVADKFLDVINQAIKDGKAPSKTSVRKFVGDEVVGEERTMVGHHTGKFDVFKRLFFTEQVNAKTKEPETRLVDLRTLKSVIVGRVRYTVK